MQDTFHERMHGRILTPPDVDIAVSLGAVQSGLAESLTARPIGAPTIIASKSYIIGIGPNLATNPGGDWKSGNVAEVINSDGVFKYVSDLDNCASFLTCHLADALCLQEHNIWGSRAHC
jgi:hypothetical protein